jgi:hypothetical protein
MKHKINWYSLGVALVLAAVLTISCRPHFAAFDCNFQGWQNPTIIVGADGVDVVLFDDRARMTMDKLHDYLSELPDRYWRSGRIVAIQVGGLGAPNTDDVIRRNVKETKRIVESLDIQIKCPNRHVIAALPPNSLEAGGGTCVVSLNRVSTICVSKWDQEC